MSVVYTIIVFFVVLGILVCVHELGHFLAAKLFKVDVEEFGFGFPPRMIGKKMGQTLYSLNWIPLGGFVKIRGVAGDDKEAYLDSRKTDLNSFQSKSIFAKIFILSAGIGMNVILAVVIFSFVFTIGFSADVQNVSDKAIVKNAAVTVSAVVSDSPADKAGIKPGDEIVGFADQDIASISEVQNTALQNVNILSSVVYRRDNNEFSTQLIPVTIEREDGSYVGIGVALQEIGTVRYPWYLAIWYGAKMTFSIVTEIIFTLGDIVKDIFKGGDVGDAVAGPIGIAVITGEAAKMGITHLLQFTALLSVNLAIFNLLPLPALDGGRIVFIILEGIRRKPVDQKIEAVVHNLGFVLLLLLVLIVTIKDVSQYNIFSFLVG